MSSKFNKFGAGAAVVALAIAGGYMARAETASKAGAVNAHPAPAAAPAVAANAPASSPRAKRAGSSMLLL